MTTVNFEFVLIYPRNEIRIEESREMPSSVMEMNQWVSGRVGAFMDGDVSIDEVQVNPKFDVDSLPEYSNGYIPTDLERLNGVCPGWTEITKSGLMCNPSVNGGIIDAEMVSGKWFVIFNDDRKSIHDIETRSEAVNAFVLAGNR